MTNSDESRPSGPALSDAEFRRLVGDTSHDDCPVEDALAALLDDVLAHLTGGRLASMGGVEDTRVFHISRATVDEWHERRRALRAPASRCQPVEDGHGGMYCRHCLKRMSLGDRRLCRVPAQPVDGGALEEILRICDFHYRNEPPRHETMHALAVEIPHIIEQLRARSPAPSQVNAAVPSQVSPAPAPDALDLEEDYEAELRYCVRRGRLMIPVADQEAAHQAAIRALHKDGDAASRPIGYIEEGVISELQLGNNWSGLIRPEPNERHRIPIFVSRDAAQQEAQRISAAAREITRRYAQGWRVSESLDDAVAAILHKHFGHSDSVEEK